MTMAVMMMMPSCCVKADRSFPVDGEGRGGPHSEAVSHKTGPAGSSEDRHHLSGSQIKRTQKQIQRQIARSKNV